MILPDVRLDVVDDLVVGLVPCDIAALASDHSGHGLSFGSGWRTIPRILAREMAAKADSTRIQLCGRLAVETDGRRIEEALPGRQGRILFGFLVLQRERALDRAELLDAVWGERLPANAASALTVQLSKLRTALPRGWLAGRSSVELQLPAGTIVDVETAITSVHRAESAVALREWPRAWTAALAAQLVADRRLLPECEAPWLDDWRRRLEDVLLRAIEAYAAACVGLGGTEVTGADRSARRLVELAPYRESGYRLLMEALAVRGNAAEALLVYDRLRIVLHEELGVAPSRELQDVHRRLLGA